MYARLVTFSGADEGRRDEMIQTVQETVLPMLRGYEGFAGYISLYGADKGRAKAIILWDTEAAAETAEETLAERRVKLAGGVGLTVESADLYEAPIVELEAARV